MSWLSINGCKPGLTITLLVAGLVSIGCANRSSAPVGGGGAVPGPNETSKLCNDSEDPNCQQQSDGDDNRTGDDGSSDGASFNLCSALNGNKDLSDVASLVEALCSSGKISRLRDEKFVYAGGDDAKVLESSDELSGEKTAMKLESSLLVDTTPKAYFEMTQLQFKKPDVFEDDAGFEVDDSVTYSIRKTETSQVRYLYENFDETDKIKYEAVTKFITLKEGVAYATATVMDDSETDPLVVLALKGLVVINKKGEETEVFSLSDQTYDNSGDHDTTRSRSLKNVKEEQKRHFKNAENAEKAGQYL